MKYEKPQITLEKYTLNVPVMAEDVASSINPVTPKGPVIERNNAVQELSDASFLEYFEFQQ